MTQPFKPVQSTKATQAVEAQLIELIRAGTVAVGQKLPAEIELARSLGVSRPVVREALGSLKAVGLVAARSGSGTFVIAKEPPSSPLLLSNHYTSDELHEVRAELEIPGAGFAARRRTRRQLTVLKKIVALQRRCDDLVEWARLDVDFHVALATATQNPVQLHLVQSLRELQDEQSRAVLRVEGRTARATREHEAILDAVAAQDEDGARQAMSYHLERIKFESHLLTGTDGGGSQAYAQPFDGSVLAGGS